ncbi:UDP-glucuronate:xylan alpha-glucuronosyltransferase 2 isoform X1 [Aristolochia californica]|uniref:UDP-glucuronate:xylan alpha-glucuronosyltransferase 2 isoform X1 n=1 Tax=Aristolochia californica TaxID=171875 RepID=UPI0035DA48FA
MHSKGFMAEMMKVTASKSLIIRINLIFFAAFLIAYAAIFLKPTSLYQGTVSPPILRCSLGECRKNKAEDGLKMKAVLETKLTKKKSVRVRRPGFVDEAVRGKKIGMINMEEIDTCDWLSKRDATTVGFDRVSENFEWKDLFPEWIDEEEDNEGPTCPEIPMPDFAQFDEVDAVVARLPCQYPEKGWGRDVVRLQVHLIAANLAVKRGRRDHKGRVRLVFWSSCRPMMELFRCDDMVKSDGQWWVYEAEVGRLEKKVSLPVGSCSLALPLWGEGINNVYDLSKLQHNRTANTTRREAYATVVHSSDAYVCGAITLAQSLRATGTTRDLLILLDKSIAGDKRQALVDAGWQIREIKRIRNPRAAKNTYNEYNYSKFRLWQLTDYDKIVFIDSDILVFRNLDVLFHFPQMSATGNDGSIFNSGVMAIEPSNCTFKILMNNRKEVVSYNGGDQGFLNEVFFWWHRLPRRVNFLKNFWSNTSLEAAMKNQLFGADPPKLYAVHYLGLKPWHCYRDYDCNWNIGDQRVYASDVAHRRWWKIHDAMDEKLQKFCGLTERRRIELAWDRKKAEEFGFADRHWSVKVSDPRRLE